MASAYHVGAAVLAHVARRGQLDSALDERSLCDASSLSFIGIRHKFSCNAILSKKANDVVILPDKIANTIC